jgi:hypothetical protein
MKNIFLALATVVAVTVYGFATCGPLKMCGDAPGYLELAAYIVHGTPARTIAATGYPYYFPHGYPLALITLNAIGTANASSIIRLNIACLVIGLWASRSLMIRQLMIPAMAANFILALAAASTVVFQMTLSAAPEMAFLAMSLASLACLCRSSRAGAWPFLLIGCVGCCCAVFIRTAGIALAPAAIWAAFVQPDVRRILSRVGLVPLAITASMLAYVAVSFVIHNPYASNVSAAGFARFKFAPDGYWLAAVAAKVSHFGEIATNLRASDFPRAYSGEFVLLGALVLAACGAGFWSQRHALGPLHVYLAAYFLMVAAYPYWQQRLWVPVIPFIFGLGYCGLQRIIAVFPPKAFPWFERAGLLYAAVFVISGCIWAVRFTNASVYADVDDGIKTGRPAAPYLAALRGTE